MHINNPEYNATGEFVKILLRYMDKFGLEAIDIAFLAHSTRANIKNLIDNKGSVELKTMETIAQAFNLHHYEFSNPAHKLPEIDVLPLRTKKRIEYRIVSGSYIQDTYSPSTINQKITIALSFLKKGDEFLTREIAERINKVDADAICNTTIIGDRLRKSFSSYSEKTNRQPSAKGIVGAAPYFFKILTTIPEVEIEKAIEEVGEYWFENYSKLVTEEKELKDANNQ